jgi:cysteine synthase A
VAERQAFRADQFNRESNTRAHYLNTGPISCGPRAGKIDAYCDLVGTGGSFAGCAMAFKEYNPAIQCFVVEPAGAAVLAAACKAAARILLQGAGYGRADLRLIKREHIDGFLSVADDEATETTRRLAREEGIFAGYTAGANAAAALQLLRGNFAGKTIAVTVCDSGMKYFSTNLWEAGENVRREK